MYCPRMKALVCSFLVRPRTCAHLVSDLCGIRAPDVSVDGRGKSHDLVRFAQANGLRDHLGLKFSCCQLQGFVVSDTVHARFCSRGGHQTLEMSDRMGNGHCTRLPKAIWFYPLCNGIADSTVATRTDPYFRFVSETWLNLD